VVSTRCCHPCSQRPHRQGRCWVAVKAAAVANTSPPPTAALAAPIVAPRLLLLPWVLPSLLPSSFSCRCSNCRAKVLAAKEWQSGLLLWRCRGSRSQSSGGEGHCCAFGGQGRCGKGGHCQGSSCQGRCGKARRLAKAAVAKAWWPRLLAQGQWLARLLRCPCKAAPSNPDSTLLT